MVGAGRIGRRRDGDALIEGTRTRGRRIRFGSASWLMTHRSARWSYMTIRVAVVPGLARPSKASPQRIHGCGPVEEGGRRGRGPLAVDGKRDVHQTARSDSDRRRRWCPAAGRRSRCRLLRNSCRDRKSARRSNSSGRSDRRLPRAQDLAHEPFLTVAGLVMGDRLDRHDVAQRARDVVTFCGDRASIAPPFSRPAAAAAPQYRRGQSHRWLQADF